MVEPAAKTSEILKKEQIETPSENYFVYFLFHSDLLPLRRLIAILVYFVSSIAFYKHFEDWDYFKCVFFIVSTISYGSPAPTNDSSRLFSIFFIFVGISVVFSSISDLANDRLASIQNFFIAIQNYFNVNNRKNQETVHYKKTMTLALFYILMILVVGASFFKYHEKWSWITAFYFAVQTSTSVGFGELHLSESTQVFLCFYIIVSIVLIAHAINSFSSVLTAQKLHRERTARLKQMQSLAFIADLNDGRGVNKHEFILAVLGHLGILDKERDIDPWVKKFDEFDTDKSGILSKEELSFFFKQETEESMEELRRLKERNKASVLTEIIEDVKDSRQTIVDKLENVLPSFGNNLRGSMFGGTPTMYTDGIVPRRGVRKTSTTTIQSEKAKRKGAKNTTAHVAAGQVDSEQTIHTTNPLHSPSARKKKAVSGKSTSPKASRDKTGSSDDAAADIEMGVIDSTRPQQQPPTEQSQTQHPSTEQQKDNTNENNPDSMKCVYVDI